MVAAGGRIYASDINDIIAGSTGKPLCVVRQQTGGQTIAHNTTVALTWDTEDVDTHGYHSTSSLTDRIVATKAGWHRVSATVMMASRSDYTRLDLLVQQNGSAALPTRAREAPGATAGSASASVEVDVYLNGAGDYIQIILTQTNGASASATTGGTGSFGSSCRVEFIRS